MKRALALLLLAAAPAAARDLDQIKAAGVLRVLAVVLNQEDVFISEQPGVGFDREVLEGFCGLHRLRLELVPQSSWGGLLPALKQGRGDVIAGRFNVTAARQAEIDFTAEVFPSRHVVLTRRPHRIVGSVEELRGERVGTVRGTSMAEIVAAAGVPADNMDDDIATGTLPEALRSGRVSAIVLGVENAMDAQRRDPALQLGTFVGPPSALAYGVRKQDDALLSALNEYIGNLRRSPTWSRLVVKYFGDAAMEVLRKARADSAGPE